MKFENIIVTNPGDSYKIIAEITSSSSQEIDDKISRARKSFSSWSNTSLQDRLHYLERVFIEIQKNKQELATLIAREVGMPISVCLQIDIEPGLNYMRGYLDNAALWLEPETVFQNSLEQHQLHFEAYGVVAVSIPWNYPVSNFIWTVAQSLVVGNTVVIKHSEYSVLACQQLEKIFNDAHFPEDVCNFIYGKGFDAGNYMIHGDIDMIWFMGSTKTGNLIYQVAGQKSIPVILELGGSAAGIVCADADLSVAIPSIYFNRFANSGQTCDGLKRLIVHSSIFDEVVHRLTDFILQKKIGSPIDLNTDIGPLVNEKQLEALRLQVDDAVAKGAKIVLGGKQPESLQGAYFQPTILVDVASDMKVWHEEVFGPALPVVPFDTLQEAIHLANDTIYGLGGYVYSSDHDTTIKISKALKTGNISINNANYVIPHDPFGGYKKSGFGRIHGKLGMQSLCSAKLIAFKK
ncbi:MAG: aldehyde dehydrogenase family protein [Candidatus Dependentiae bacterium]|nr:aldehyde dehydrogenase family protein [Candidatus Dependentiae bacterium]